VSFDDEFAKDYQEHIAVAAKNITADFGCGRTSVNRWIVEYPRLFDEFCDIDGRPRFTHSSTLRSNMTASMTPWLGSAVRGSASAHK
jgi:hypothetical protein